MCHDVPLVFISQTHPTRPADDQVFLSFLPQRIASDRPDLQLPDGTSDVCLAPRWKTRHTEGVEDG